MVRCLRVALVVTMLSSTACSPMYLAARPPVDLSGYRGEGTVTRLKHPINPGFMVDFTGFPLDAPSSTTFQLDGLPKPRHDSPYELALVVHLDQDEASRWPEVPPWLTLHALGTLGLRVTSVTGLVLFDCQCPLADQHWQRRTDEDVLFAVLRVRTPPGVRASRFPSDAKPEQAPAELDVEYTPGADSLARCGF
jgi:hypothetical protein